MRQSVLVRVKSNEDANRRKATEMIPVSDELIAWLDRCGMRGNVSGNMALHGKKERAAAMGSAAPQVPAKAREEKPLHGGGMGISVAGSHDSLRPWGQVKEPSSEHMPRPVLTLAWDNDRCLGTASPTRKPRAAVSKHLALVWSADHD